jgi:membrane fusion protein, multidrug efflux system
LATAVVRFVSPKVDPATQTLLIKADVPANAGLKADEKVSIRVVTGFSQQVTVPAEAIMRMMGQPFVYRLAMANGQATAQLQPVVLGGYQNNNMVITKGLSAGDQIVVHGIQKLQDGAPIMDSAKMPPTPQQASSHTPEGM